MQKYIDDKLYAGISTMVCRKGALVHKSFVGYADIASRKKLGPATLYRVYSMTKPITATLVMTLFEEGKLRLTDLISDYLPEFKNIKVLEVDDEGNQTYVKPRRPPTIHDLLTHTAGFSYHFAEDTPVAKMYDMSSFEVDNLRSFISALSVVPLAFHPGSRWHYGLNIDVAACITEIVADMPFQELLNIRLLNPLEMNDTYFTVPYSERSRIATMYGVMDIGHSEFNSTKAEKMYSEQKHLQVLDAQKSSPCNREGFARGGHGLIMTLDDYARFCQMLLNKGELNGARILGRKTIEFMHENHVSKKILQATWDSEQLQGYGQALGSRVCLNPPAAQVISSPGEYGWGGAAKTFYWIDPQEEMFGVFMTQKMSANEKPDKDLMNLTYQALID
jgi:CubicO group peptidase (beta-lactamase class C family)